MLPLLHGGGDFDRLAEASASQWCACTDAEQDGESAPTSHRADHRIDRSLTYLGSHCWGTVRTWISGYESQLLSSSACSLSPAAALGLRRLAYRMFRMTLADQLPWVTSPISRR